MPLNAAIWGDIAAMLTLLNAGADINAVGERGYTPLHETVEQGHYEATKFLLNSGASNFIKNNSGLTAGELSVILGDTAIRTLFNR